MQYIEKRTLSVGLLFCSFASAFAGTPASPQATPVPFDLPVIGNVQVTGSDTRAADFNKNWLPKFQAIVDNNLRESVVFSGASGFKLDSSKLFLRQTANQQIRVYFLGEGAGYQNSLGFAFTPAGSPTPGTPRMIYPNVSVGSSRSTSTPLKAGDYVEIGVGGNGWQLDFFLLSNGFSTWQSYRSQSNYWTKPQPSIPYLWNDVTKNSDAIQHVVSFVLPNSPYILLGFEDIVGGGDLDYNDALFVVDIGIENTDNLTTGPSLPQ